MNGPDRPPTRATVSQAREHLLAGTTEGAAAVRGDIATSWRRSLRTGVVPDSVDVPYEDSLRTPHRLLDAARPVVDRIAGQLLDTSATFLLANADAQIIERWASRSFLPTLDRFNVAPGFVYAEDRVGTNGVGCALEERRMFEVRGPEHFRDCLQSLVCVAAPIALPTTKAVQGALNVTCSVEEANGFLRPLIRQAISDIEQRLLEATSLGERLLLDGFLARSRGKAHAVLAMNGDLVMANQAADRTVSADDRAVLWHWATDALRTHDSATHSMVLGDRDPVTVTATKIGDGPRLIGALIEVHLPRQQEGTTRRKASAGPTLDGGEVVTGRSTASERLRRASVAAGSACGPIVVVGPPGSGKTRIAQAIASLRRPAAPLVVDGPARCSDALSLEAEATVIVRRVHDHPVEKLDRFLEAARHRDLHVIATASDGRDADRHIAMFGHRVEVPSLHRRSDDIPALAAHILGEVTGDRRTPRIRPDALGALMRHDWPGNIRELRAALICASEAAGSDDIAEYHLPEPIGADAGSSRWSPIELAERQAILHALAEHEGNKLAAASALGLARSTLYRKLRTFGIDIS